MITEKWYYWDRWSWWQAGLYSSIPLQRSTTYQEQETEEEL